VAAKGTKVKHFFNTFYTKNYSTKKLPVENFIRLFCFSMERKRPYMFFGEPGAVSGSSVGVNPKPNTAYIAPFSYVAFLWSFDNNRLRLFYDIEIAI
jgi:hypothetical protein